MSFFIYVCISTLEPHGIFLSQFEYLYACQHSLTTGIQNHPFDRHRFTEQLSSLLWLVKILITPEPYGLFAYLFFFIIVQPLVCKKVARFC